VLKVVEQDAEGELKRALSVTDLIIYGMVYMLPIAPFALFGIIVFTRRELATAQGTQ